MRRPRGVSNHQVAPAEWRASTPNITGDYDLDATIMHRPNRNLPDRLELYTRHPKRGYGPRTAYNGYSGYHGDE